MLITPRQSPDYCKQVIAWRFRLRNESSDRLLESACATVLDWVCNATGDDFNLLLNTLGMDYTLF